MLHGTVNAVDGFAMAMVVILTLSMSVVALLLYCISRNGKKREREVEDLIEEVRRAEEDEEKRLPAAPASGEAREPWEKEEDWWKK